mmetsp:Transcript_107176/g.331135  ORF Transcript_107176/g.331135 Transcript_107176/m.331135 type:complete len:258 (-) Transcript_107176:376-1149(-)
MVVVGHGPVISCFEERLKEPTVPRRLRRRGSFTGAAGAPHPRAAEQSCLAPLDPGEEPPCSAERPAPVRVPQENAVEVRVLPLGVTVGAVVAPGNVDRAVDLLHHLLHCLLVHRPREVVIACTHAGDEPQDAGHGLGEVPSHLIHRNLEHQAVVAPTHQVRKHVPDHVRRAHVLQSQTRGGRPPGSVSKQRHVAATVVTTAEDGMPGLYSAAIAGQPMEGTHRRILLEPLPRVVLEGADDQVDGVPHKVQHPASVAG